MIAIQEANANLSASWKGRDMYRIAQGGKRGHRVIELWISDVVVARDDEGAVRLDQKSFTLIDQMEGALLIRYSTVILCFDVLAAHAPT